ncbi:hypothetical protein [Polyangium aurulentum]|uniref:hypothetical protein n=1 Tax=Polyangium aurulentum TaxID=2567896 RepID=UPI00146D1E40|nr:hypothetical protein [Polyangium aurulentum]UQA58349.1 hypothetical protein E8A73_045075 [Polyangium aurulentum]
MRIARALPKHLFAISLTALLGLVACGGDDTGNPSGSGGSGASGGGNQGGAGGAGGQGGAGGAGGQGGAGGGGMSGFAAVVLPSSRAVVEANDGGVLVAGCGAQKDGMPYGGAFTSTVTVSPDTGVTKNGNSITFAEAGIFTVSCQVQVEGQTVTAETDISVLNEAISPLVAKAAMGVSGVGAGLHRLLAANGGSDQALVDAVAALDASVAGIDVATYAELSDILRKVPGGYPTSDALTAAGIASSPDDAALPGGMDDFAAALAALRSTIAGIDPKNPTAADEAALAARSAELESAVKKLSALTPSTHGVLATRQKMALLVRDEIVPATRAVGKLASDVAHAAAPDILKVKGDADSSASKGPGGPANFGFFSLAIGMFGQSTLQMQLVNQWYGDYIKEIDKSLNNLILLKMIDYILPPDPGGPVIEMLQSSFGQGFAVPGYDTWVYGKNFNSDPEYNMFIVIGDGWQTVAENVWTACGVAEADTVPEKIETVANCIKDTIEAVNNSLPQYSMEVIDPGDLADQDVHMGPFPEACSGSLPLAIGIIPVNLAVGRGPTFLSNCIKP